MRREQQQNSPLRWLTLDYNKSEFFYILGPMQLNQAESYELVCLAGDGGQAQVYLARKQQ